jgi:hypothetical protein
LFPIAPDELWTSKDDKLSQICDAIYKGDLKVIETLLQESSADTMMCHPLCDCDKCIQLSHVLNLKDDLAGRTPLSLASLLGKPLIVEHFLKYWL